MSGSKQTGLTLILVAGKNDVGSAFGLLLPPEGTERWHGLLGARLHLHRAHSVPNDLLLFLHSGELSVEAPRYVLEGLLRRHDFAVVVAVLQPHVVLHHRGVQWCVILVVPSEFPSIAEFAPGPEPPEGTGDAPVQRAVVGADLKSRALGFLSTLTMGVSTMRQNSLVELISN
eukprot:Polyplicarium_translucidae@DN4658_c0_g1_i1.p1